MFIFIGTKEEFAAVAAAVDLDKAVNLKPETTNPEPTPTPAPAQIHKPAPAPEPITEEKIDDLGPTFTGIDFGTAEEIDYDESPF